MKKRILCVGMVVVLLILLCACKDEKTTSSTENSKPTQSVSSQETSTNDSSSSEIESTVSENQQAEKPDESSSKTEPQVSSQKPVVSSKPVTPSKVETPSKAETPSKEEKPIDNTPAGLIVGKWTGNIDVSEQVEAEGITLTEPAIMEVSSVFEKNGVYKEIITKEAYMDYLWILFRADMAASGLDLVDYKGNFARDHGMLLEKYIEYAAEDMANQKITGVYKFEGDTLYIKYDTEADYIQIPYTFSNNNKTVELINEGVSMILNKVS